MSTCHRLIQVRTVIIINLGRLAGLGAAAKGFRGEPGNSSAILEVKDWLLSISSVTPVEGKMFVQGCYTVCHIKHGPPVNNQFSDSLSMLAYSAPSAEQTSYSPSATEEVKQGQSFSLPCFGIQM